MENRISSFIAFFLEKSEVGFLFGVDYGKVLVKENGPSSTNEKESLISGQLYEIIFREEGIEEKRYNFYHFQQTSPHCFKIQS